MVEGTGTVVVPVRHRLAWLLLSVPAALFAAAMAFTQPGSGSAGHIAGAVGNLIWVTLVVTVTVTVWIRRIPMATFDRYGVRMPFLRLFAPWTDMEGGAVKHKGQELVLNLRKDGGVRLPRKGRPPSLSESRPGTSTLRFPQVLTGQPVEELADLAEAGGVTLDRPPYHQRTTLLERTVIGLGLVLLFLSSQKVHHLYQTVYFWAGLVVIGLSFLGRRSMEAAMASIVTVNVLLIGFVILFPGPNVLTRANTLFELTLSLGGLLAVVDWKYTRIPSRRKR